MANRHDDDLDALDDTELDEVNGGFGYKGSYGSLDAGYGFGGIGVGGGIAQGGPTGAYYGSVSAGTPSFGISGGAQANVMFGRDGASFESIMTGPSSTVQFGFGQVTWSRGEDGSIQGFSIGLGPSGIGYSRSETTNLGGGIEHDNTGVDHSNEVIQPGSLAEQAGIRDIGAHQWDDSFAHPGEIQNPVDPHQIAQDAAANHGPQDANHDTPQDGNHDTPQDGNHDTPQDGNHDTPQDGNHDTPQDGNHDTPGNDFGDPNGGGGGTQYADAGNGSHDSGDGGGSYDSGHDAGGGGYDGGGTQYADAGGGGGGGDDGGGSDFA